MASLDLSAVQNLVSAWWFDYDQGTFDAWPGYFTTDAHFSCRSDSGQTPFEDFIRADLMGRDDIVAWQVDHRRDSPYPLRHNATNVHITETRPGEADFRCYLFVTQIVSGAVSNLSSGRCLGTVRREGDGVRLADLRVVLDFTESQPFREAAC
jgi:3-phenylpropionate/cinnamic acid dioxygenase small subunit